jgi:hypothetical protein
MMDMSYTKYEVKNNNMKRFETKEDLDREIKAIQKYCSMFGCSYEKLGINDIDFKLMSGMDVIGYVEVKGRLSYLRNAYPLPIAMRKLVKLCDKMLNPIVIWACDDGIIYGDPRELKGIAKFSGRKKQREGSFHDREMMVYFDRQSGLKYLRY